MAAEARALVYPCLVYVWNYGSESRLETALSKDGVGFTVVAR